MSPTSRFFQMNVYWWDSLAVKPKAASRSPPQTSSNHLFSFNIEQRDLFQVELDGHLFTQME
jgi:hypothetical protein